MWDTGVCMVKKQMTILVSQGTIVYCQYGGHLRPNDKFEHILEIPVALCFYGYSKYAFHSSLIIHHITVQLKVMKYG